MNKHRYNPDGGGESYLIPSTVASALKWCTLEEVEVIARAAAHELRARREMPNEGRDWRTEECRVRRGSYRLQEGR